MKSRVPRIEMPNRVATCFSARRAAASSRSAMRGRCSGRPGLVKRSGRPPSPTTCPSSRRTAVPWAGATSLPGWVESCSFIGIPIFSSMCGWGRGWRLGRLGTEPDGTAHEDAEPEDPGEQTLGDRAERAERHAAGLLLLVDGVEEGDDVALALAVEVAVVEHGHALRAGEHGLVYVPVGDVAA